VALRLHPQMGAALLTRHLHTPARHTVADALFCRLGRIGGNKGFGRPFSPGIARQHPADRQRVGARTGPPCGASADLPGSLPLTIPIQGELLPGSVWALSDLFQGRKTLTDHPGAATGVLGTDRRGFRKDRIQPASRDQRHLRTLCMQPPFQHGGGGLAQTLDGAVGKPSASQADQVMRPPPDRRVPRAQLFTSLWSRGTSAHERQRPAVLCLRQRHHHCHHDPARTGTAHRPLAAGESALAVMSACADRAAPSPLSGVIDDQIHARSGWHNGRNTEQEELTTHRQRRPTGSVALGRCHAGGLLTLVRIGNALPGPGSAAEQAPPPLREMEPPGSSGKEHVLDAWMFRSPGASLPVGVTAERVRNDEEIPRWMVCFDVLEHRDGMPGMARGGISRPFLAIASPQGASNARVLWSPAVLQRRCDAVAMGAPAWDGCTRAWDSGPRSSVQMVVDP